MLFLLKSDLILVWLCQYDCVSYAPDIFDSTNFHILFAQFLNLIIHNKINVTYDEPHNTITKNLILNIQIITKLSNYLDAFKVLVL